MIEPIINSNKVRYSKLITEVQKNITEGDKLAIYINLDSVFGFFYTKQFMENLNHISPEMYISMSSELINIAAHYRHFFASRYNVKTVIFFYTSKGKPMENLRYNPNYYSNMSDKKDNTNQIYSTVNAFINQNMELFSKVCEYIHDVFYINIKDVEPTLIPHMLMKRIDSTYDDFNHLTITRDINDYQLVNTSEKSFILRLQGEKSRILNKDNIITDILEKSNVKYTPDIDISSSLLTLLLSVSGLKSRNVKGLKGVGFASILKRLEKKIVGNKMINGYIADIMNTASNIGFSDSASSVIFDNFRCLDIRHQYKYIPDSYNMILSDQLINRYNNEDIMSINDEYYRLNPIQLIQLSELVDYRESLMR